MDEELGRIRREIDALDRQIVSLLEKRVEAAKRIGRLKEKRGLPVSDPAREKEVLDGVCAATSLDKRFIKTLFFEIIEYCKDAEKK